MKRSSILLAVLGLVLINSCKKENQSDQYPAEKQDELLTKLNEEAFVTPEQAQSLALNLFNEGSKNNPVALMSSRKRAGFSISSEARAIDTVVAIKDKDNVNAFYIINYSDNGFCILSADNRAYPILAYSDETKFSFEDGSEAITGWLLDAKENIEAIRTVPFTVRPVGEKKLQGVSKTMAYPYDPPEIINPVTVQIEYHAPLVMTRWNQGTGYNNLAPNFICTGSGSPSNGRAWAGCVATAIGQIAAYHQHPSSYNWASMPNLTGSAETSRLLRDIGDAVDMDWGCDGSGTNGGTKTVLGFNMLGYTMSKREFEAFTSSDPTDYFMTEIRNDRPFLISGGRQGNFLIFNYYKNGHEWVCDGFDRYKYSYTEVIQVDFDTWIYNDVVTYPTYFHMNWGWGGQHDGWFRIGEFAPTVENYRDTYRDDFPGTYNYKNIMYYNINPI